MPIWLIETFGAHDLERAFLFIALMTAPAWFVMVFFARQRWVQSLAQPFVLSPLYALVLVYVLWMSYDAALLPGSVQTNVSYSAAQEFSRHPMIFLALFCNWQVLNIAIGTVIFQKAQRSGFRASFELVFCWLFGALALLPFSLRLLLRRQSLK